MKIEYENRTYEFDIIRLSVGECEEIEKFCSARGMGEWTLQLATANTKAIQALWWVIRRHAGEDAGPVGRRDPGFLPLALNNAYSTATEVQAAEEAAAKKAAEEAEEAKPDPTPPARSSPAPAATSPSTRRSTSSTPKRGIERSSVPSWRLTSGWPGPSPKGR